MFNNNSRLKVSSIYFSITPTILTQMKVLSAAKKVFASLKEYRFKENEILVVHLW